jgi:FAD:protein FMN transferase
MSKRPKTIRCLLLATGLTLTLACTDLRKDLHVSGKTMGTTYHITLVAGYFYNEKPLLKKIEDRLGEINRSMSTYLPDSEISRFNALQQTDRAFCPSRDFVSVMTRAEELFRLTAGAWDGTVNPLVRLWGFGNVQKEPAVPPDELIERMRPLVGFDKIQLTREGCLVKRHPEITVDLASIAKGYGVDALARLILDSGFENFLVEIGGEVYTLGERKDGKPWQVGINTPAKDASFNSIYTVVPLKDRALATSGNYRNFFEVDGKMYSHLLDPRTGRPVRNDVASASVMAGNCTFADGLATALVVLGRERGLDLVNRIEGVECLIIVREEDGSLTDHASVGFPDH